MLTEPHSDEALALRARCEQAGDNLIAPALWLYEVTNVLSKRVAKQQLSPAEAKTALEALVETSPELIVKPDLAPRAVELAAEFAVMASYDFHYVALAEALGCEFWTGDEHLYNLASGRFPFVRWIGEAHA